MLSEAVYWVKEHIGVVAAAFFVVLLGGMMVFSFVVSSQGGAQEEPDRIQPDYVGTWYHCENGDMYVLTLSADGTARYYDDTLVQALNYGRWEVEEDGKVVFSDLEGDQPSTMQGDEFAFYTTPEEDGSVPEKPSTLTYKGSFSSSQKWLFWPSRDSALSDWNERNPNKEDQWRSAS